MASVVNARNSICYVVCPNSDEGGAARQLG